MTKSTAFEKLKKLTLDQKVLLLTHTDMDGSGAAILLKTLLSDNVTVEYCNNATMSKKIKEHIVENKINPEYDTIMVCDISCNDIDAEIIDDMHVDNQLVILDHHESAKNLNNYKWACVESEIIDDSFRKLFYDAVLSNTNNKTAHSSGTSLMYDYLEYCGLINEALYNRKELQELTHLIATYDTWDWKNVFDGLTICQNIQILFESVGQTYFESLMIDNLRNQKAIISGVSAMFLEIEKSKINEHLSRVKNSIIFGSTIINNKNYKIAYIFTNKYLSHIFEWMKAEYPNIDIHIICYGSGISLRTSKDDIDLSEITKSLNGGGHTKAAGIKASFDLQKEYLSKMLNAPIDTTLWKGLI